MPQLRVTDLEDSWYSRPQYFPRIGQAARSTWFLRAPAFQPLTNVPVGAPREPAVDRTRLRSAFEETYATWNIPVSDRARDSLAAIGQAGTAVIATGQQPGFLGGPLHTLYKALTAIAAARRYEKLSGRTCVPVFWVAGDDHDFEEVREVRFPAAAGDVSFRFPGKADRRPVADYPVTSDVEAVLDAATSHFAERRHGADARNLVDLYRGRGLASGFAALLVELLGSSGLLVIDPCTLRGLAVRIFRGVIEDPRLTMELVEKGRREVAAAGIEPFVAARLPLFIVRDGKRHHLSPGINGLRIDGGGPEISTQEALQVLAANPRSFSPGALLRPLVQEECLPCVLSIGGPAEVGYFAQIGPLAAHFDFATPPIALRCNATILDGKLARAAVSLPLDRLCQARSPEDLLDPAAVPASLQAIHELASRVEADLTLAVGQLAQGHDVDRLQRRARELGRDVSTFAERLNKAHLGRRTHELEEARKLWKFILPGYELQERHWGLLHFIARHGRDWIDELLAAIEPEPLKVVHRLITFEA